MPRASVPAMASFLNDEWRTDLIKGWNAKNWFMQTNTPGDRVGRLNGAQAGTTVVGDTLSIKVFQAVAAGMAMGPNRKVILSDNGNFPTDLYMVEGLIKHQGCRIQAARADPEKCWTAIPMRSAW